MKRAGFTLVEVMVGIILTSIVLGAGYQIWSSSRRDFSVANTRQILQHEIRTSLNWMANDFRAIKANTLNVVANPEGSSATVFIERFAKAEATDKFSSENIEKVRYEFRRPRLTRISGNEVAHVLGNNIEGMTFTRGESAENPTAADPNSVKADTKRGLDARLDISMWGQKRIPGMNKFAEHTEKVTVFMRDEYYASINKGRYLALEELNATQASNIFQEKGESNQLLEGGELTPEMLADLSRQQLDELLTKERGLLADAQSKIKDMNDAIGALDTKKSGWWIFRGNSELTSIQKDLKNHTKPDEIKADKEKLQAVIDKYEKQNLQESLKQGLNAEEILNDKVNGPIYRDAFNLLVKDRQLKKAYEDQESSEEGGESKPYVSLLSQTDPSKMQRGVAADGSAFEESEAQFTERHDHAQKIFDAANNMDIKWMDEKDGEDRVRLYGTAKDLMDFADAKLSYVEDQAIRETNITNINDAISKKS